MGTREWFTEKSVLGTNRTELESVESNKNVHGPTPLGSVHNVTFNECVEAGRGDAAQVRVISIQQEREEVHAALQCSASVHGLVEEWTDCEELRPKPKKSEFLLINKGCKEASTGVVCGSKHLSMCEMRKKQQTRGN